MPPGVELTGQIAMGHRVGKLLHAVLIGLAEERGFAGATGRRDDDDQQGNPDATEAAIRVHALRFESAGD
jgi:hypothetical protein